MANSISLQRGFHAIAYNKRPIVSPTISQSFHKWVDSWVRAIPSSEDVLIKARSFTGMLAPIVGCSILGGAVCLVLSFALAPLFPVSLLLLSLGITFLVIGLSTSCSQLLLSVFWDTRLNRSASQSEGKEVVLYVLPKDDGSPTLHMCSHNAVLEASKGKKLVVARVAAEGELTELINKYRNISHLWINGHGARDRIYLGRDWHIKADIAKSWPRFHFTTDAQVILDSCSTAAAQPKQGLKSLSFAEALFHHLRRQVTVLGASHSITGAEINREGKIVLRRFFSDYTVRFNSHPVHPYMRYFLVSIDYLHRLYTSLNRVSTRGLALLYP